MFLCRRKALWMPSFVCACCWLFWRPLTCKVHAQETKRTVWMLRVTQVSVLFRLWGIFIPCFSIYEKQCSSPSTRNIKTTRTATATRTSLHRADKQNTNLCVIFCRPLQNNTKWPYCEDFEKRSRGPRRLSFRILFWTLSLHHLLGLVFKVLKSDWYTE